jgi:hypothetical protein
MGTITQDKDAVTGEFNENVFRTVAGAMRFFESLKSAGALAKSVSPSGDSEP